MLKIIVDFFHELATVVWIGGMVYANLILMPAVATIEAAERGKLLGAAVKRFTLISWISVIVLIITGIFKAISPEMSEISQPAATVLKVKYLVFALMLVIGILITFVFGPKMKSLMAKPGEKLSLEFLQAQSRISTLAMITMILGILVLLLVAIG